MAEQRKQHYVPKFYLKFFSLSENKKQIKVYLKNSGKIIQKANLESQAQESYFYGKNLKTEKWFANVEDNTAEILKQVIKEKIIPTNGSENYYQISLFLLLQPYRTRVNSDEFNDMVDKTLKAVMKFETQFKNFEYDKYFFAYNDAVEKSLSILLDNLSIMLDMQIKLLINKTSKEFITSDHPVSKYNQFLESRNFFFGHTGMMSKGLQLFYPLAPDLCLVMYDPKVYKIGNKKQFSNINVNEKDVESLNILTCLHANKSMYATDKLTDFQFEHILEKANKFRDQKKLELKYYDSVGNGDDTESVIVQHHRIPFQIKLDLSFIKQTQHAKSYKLSGYFSEIRDERWRNRKYLLEFLKNKETSI
jgi:hypothetical protein